MFIQEEKPSISYDSLLITLSLNCMTLQTSKTSPMNKKNILIEFEPEALKQYEDALGSLCRHFGGLGDLNTLLSKIAAANDSQNFTY